MVVHESQVLHIKSHGAVPGLLRRSALHTPNERARTECHHARGQGDHSLPSYDHVQYTQVSGSSRNLLPHTDG